MKFCKLNAMNNSCSKCFHYGKCQLNKPQERTLCHTCRQDYESAGYIVKPIKGDICGQCELCGRRAFDCLVGKD